LIQEFYTLPEYLSSRSGNLSARTSGVPSATSRARVGRVVLVSKVSVVESSVGKADQSSGRSDVAVDGLDIDLQRAYHDLSPTQLVELVNAGGVNVLANTSPASGSHAHRAALAGGVQRELLPNSLVVCFAGVELRAAKANSR
jgi:hypothetical protein